MKRNLLMMIALLAAMMPIQAQETVKLIFTATTTDGNYSLFTYVSATNLTRGWTETLLYPDTVLVLTNSVGIGEQQDLDGLRLGEAFPNPFTKETNVLLEIPEDGEALIQLVDINGVTLASEQAYLAAGTHRLKVLLSIPSMAFLCVTTNHGRQVTRLLNTNCGGVNRISVETIGAPKPCPMRSSLVGDFEPGDVMSYEAVLVNGNDSLRSEVITQEQFTDETIVLMFPNTGPTGMIKGKFSVDANGTQVYFSQGNLQYIGSAIPPYWKLAERQWECFSDNGQGSANQNADRDLFGWGTSGWPNGNVYYQPYDTQDNGNSSQGYGYGPTDETSYTYDLTGTYANADWGVYNAISNGGNTTGLWRTLTRDEWVYVFQGRSGAASKYGHGKVNGVNGMILLPDEWTLPSGLSFTPGNNSWVNVYTMGQWELMEDNGAVFLPAAGTRDGTSVELVGSYGNYWSSSCFYSSTSYYVNFHDSSVSPQGYGIIRCCGLSVRLVCPAE